jgi:hypothetical protein
LNRPTAHRGRAAVLVHRPRSPDFCLDAVASYLDISLAEDPDRGDGNAENMIIMITEAVVFGPSLD